VFSKVHELSDDDHIDPLFIKGMPHCAFTAGADQVFGDQLNDALTEGPGTDRCDRGTGTDTAVTCETRISIP
jgi:hypothetical protein